MSQQDQQKFGIHAASVLIVYRQRSEHGWKRGKPGPIMPMAAAVIPVTLITLLGSKGPNASIRADVRYWRAQQWPRTHYLEVTTRSIVRAVSESRSIQSSVSRGADGSA